MTGRIRVIAMESERGLLDGDGTTVVTGIGPLNVIRSMDGIDRDTPLLCVGYAGSNTIGIGRRVAVGKVGTHHPNSDYDEPSFCLGGDVPCYTSSDFVTETSIEEPCVFDMELAYILAMGFTDVVAEKVVSDQLSITEYEKTMTEASHG